MRPLIGNRTAAALLLSIGLLLPARAGTLFPGDALLALTDLDFDGATQSVAAERVDALFQRLEIPAADRARYAFMRGARFAKQNSYFETEELTETVLIAQAGVRIAFANNVVIVAGGDVHVIHGSGLLIISGGSIDVTHAESLGKVPGTFVAKGRVHVDSGSSATVYAVQGARLDRFAEAIAYNCDVSGVQYGKVYRHARAALFRGEPIRAPEPPSMRISSGETLKFTGERCRGGVDLQMLADRLPPYARREANCPKIDSVSVRCEAPGRERWTFDLCGRTQDIIVSGAARSSNISIAAVPARGTNPPGRYGSQPRAVPSGPRDLALERRLREFAQQAAAASASGRREDAIAAYSEMIALDPGNGAAYLNRGNQKSALDDVPGTVADYTRAIELGQQASTTYSMRGLAYLRLGDAARGLADLKRSVALSSNATELFNRALGYLFVGQLGAAHGDFDRLIGRNPRDVRAYLWRGWVNLLSGDGAGATRDASAVFVVDGERMLKNFRYYGGAYAVLAGYYGYLLLARDDEAKAWLGQWRDALDGDAWPDAVALHLLGTLDRDAIGKAEHRARQRIGTQAFLALDAMLKGRVDESRVTFSRLAQENDAYDLARVITERALASGPGFKH